MSQSSAFIKNSILCRCPKCGKSSIYSGLLTVKKNCENCNFPTLKHDAGDGPAFFAMSIAGTIVCILAFILDIYLQPSIWLHIIIWTPIVLIISIWLLRVIKTALIISEYNNGLLLSGKKRKK